MEMITDRELLQELARAVLRYDETIQEVARQRAAVAGDAPGAWTVDGALGQQLDALYADLKTKARAALNRKEPT